MNASATSTEREALDALEPRLISDGYQLIRDPRQEQLPPFLKGLRPDAIAVGRKPYLLIEVISRGSTDAVVSAKQTQLRSLVAQDADWALQLVSAGSGSQLPTVHLLPTIRDRFEEIRSLAAVDRRAALVMALGVLEAVARRAMPDRAARALTPATTIEVLTTLGYIVQSEAETLRKAVRIRNLIVHGDFEVDVPPDLLGEVLDIVDALLRHLEAGEA